LLESFVYPESESLVITTEKFGKKKSLYLLDSKGQKGEDMSK